MYLCQFSSICDLLQLLGLILYLCVDDFLPDCMFSFTDALFHLQFFLFSVVALSFLLREVSLAFAVELFGCS